MDKITIAYVIAIVAGLFLAAWRLQKVRTTYGSAYWLKPWTADGRGLFKDDGGVLAGDWTGLLPVYYRGDGHVLTCAPTGGGKGTAAILPNLLRYPWLFVLDPGGENTAVAIKAWRNKGYQVFCLNPWGMHEAAPWALPRHSINPLDILDPNSRTFASDADLLAEMIVSRSGHESGNSSYFNDQAQAGLRATMMHIVTTEPPESRNLFAVRRAIAGDEASWTAVIKAMKRNPACGGLIAREAAQLERREGQASEEFSAIQSTMKQHTDFIEDPVMQDALCSSDANLSALKGMRNGKSLAGCVVSVVVPLQYKDTHAAYSRLILAVALWAMQRPPLAQRRVLFVLDEFPSLGRVKRVSMGLAELRKYNVCLWPVVQNLGQLSGIYGKEWQTFIGNCGMKQFIGAADLETANYVSALCGGATIEVTQGRGAQARSFETGRALATAEEVMRGNERLQYVFMDELKPMLLLKTPYWMRPELRGQYLPNPYRPGVLEPNANAPLKAVWGQLYWLCAWLVRPSPYAVAALVIFLLIQADAAVNIGGTVDRQKSVAICRYTGTPETRAIACLCAQDGRRFVCVFERFSPQELFRFARAEPCPETDNDSSAGLLLRGAPALKEFSCKEFDFSGWHCHFCGDARGFVSCGSECGFVCRSRTVTRGSAAYFYCHPGCGAAGPVAPVSSVSGSTGGGAKPLSLLPGSRMLSGPALPRLGGPRK